MDLYLDWATSSYNPSQPDSGGKARVGRVSNVILHQVPPEPVGEVEEAVIKGYKDVRDEGGHLRQNPALHFGPGLTNDHRRLPFVIAILQFSHHNIT